MLLNYILFYSILEFEKKKFHDEEEKWIDFLEALVFTLEQWFSTGVQPNFSRCAAKSFNVKESMHK